MTRRIQWEQIGLAIAALCCTLTAAAQQTDGILLHPLFQNHAVLQRDQPIKLWGEAAPGATVTVALARKEVSTRADATGHWQATLPPMPAGGPYALSVRAGQAHQRVDDLLVGDVWLCSGQSNMELPVWRSLDASSEIAAAAHPTLRLFTVPQAASASPQQSFHAPVAWHPATPDSARDFSAACFYFARELQKTVNVPMGLIQAAWGGSRIEAWTRADALRAHGGMDTALDLLTLSSRDPVAARAKWGEQWEQWWASRPGRTADDTPWRPDRQGSGWQKAPLQLGAWERWGVPALSSYNGMVWYRTDVTLTAAQAEQGAVLELGPVDETDMTWVNGVGVGSEYAPGQSRAYPLPAGLLKAGTNSVVINVLDTWADGGLAGPADAHAVRFDDDTRVVLGPQWSFRPAPESAAPPLAPWHAATGLSTLYNGMIAPLGNLGLRGLLWYQGESNTADGPAYATRLRTLRDDWRNQFGAQTPLLVVQLAGYGQPADAPVESGWAEVREAQRRVVAEDPHSGLAVAIDLGDAYDIHPPNKQELGRRLARAARYVVYGEDTSAPSGPSPHDARRVNDEVRIRFDDVEGALVTTGANGPIGFELCEAIPGRCRYADASLDGREVILRGPHVASGARVRYCWADGPVCTLHDRSGAPAGPFELPVEDGASR
ncbi:sialate O-acetylesterase [Stenotrophomonas sp. PS02289]|uniref:sialate O-acetylesterase n=1 Tax=Stenotrophomonas sp. PS02289 TaxID=2991422 RepID=UPI00249B9BBB|nr:sialate O-acetylesterase [Stenotrophomonas sp. PS02289]